MLSFTITEKCKAKKWIINNRHRQSERVVKILKAGEKIRIRY